MYEKKNRNKSLENNKLNANAGRLNELLALLLISLYNFSVVENQFKSAKIASRCHTLNNIDILSE